MKPFNILFIASHILLLGSLGACQWNLLQSSNSSKDNPLSCQDNSTCIKDTSCKDQETCQVPDDCGVSLACDDDAKGDDCQTNHCPQYCETHHCSAVVSLNGSCSGVFIAPRLILSSDICVGSLESIVDAFGRVYHPLAKYSGNPEIVNHTLRSGIDLLLIQTQEEFAGPFYQFSKVRQDLESLFEKAAGRYRPESEILRVLSFENFRNTESHRDLEYINYRFNLSSDGKESVFGSRFLSTCEHGFIVDDQQKMILAVASRWLFPDSDCSKETDGKIYTNIDQQAVDELRRNLDLRSGSFEY